MLARVKRIKGQQARHDAQWGLSVPVCAAQRSPGRAETPTVSARASLLSQLNCHRVLWIKPELLALSGRPAIEPGHI